MLTIGEFSRASRLSAKALRLYDELGLLRPARVDPLSGYRFYAPGQLDRARLVAWLRRLGMPLARIRLVCDAASPAAAAAEVAAFWAQAEADHASRRDLAAFLTRYLEGEEAPMAPADAGLAIRYAAASDTGRRRAANQDSAYAGTRLLAVADGMGGAGHLASAAAIDALKPLETAPPAGDLLNALENAVQQAGAAVAGIAAGQPARRGQRHHADRDAVGGLPAGPGAHRGHPCLPAARRRAVPDHPRPHGRPVADRRGAADPGARPSRTRSAPCCCARWTAAGRRRTCRCTTPGPVTGTCSARTG